MRRILCLLLLALLALPMGAKEKGSVRPDEWKKVHYAKDEILPDAKIGEGMATVRACVLGMKPDKKLTLFIGNYTPLDAPHDFEGMFPIDDGTVEAQVPVRLTRQVLVLIPELEEAVAMVLVAPGEVTEMLIDLEAEGCPFIDFRGFMARTNKECTDDFWEALQHRKTDDLKLYDELNKQETPDQRVQFFKARLEAKKSAINKRRLTSASKALLRMEAENDYRSWTIYFARNYIDLQERTGAEPRIVDSEAYMKKLSEYEQMMPPSSLMATIPDNDAFEMTSRRYAPASPAFWAYNHWYRYACDPYTAQLRLLQTVLTDKILHLTDKLREEITLPDHVAILQAYDDGQQRKREDFNRQAGVFFHTLDSVPAKDILPALLNRYKGQVVLFDIWATWCGPCRQGHRLMAPMKEELKDKPVTFVYLTCDTSPAGTWDEMIKDIPGEHYYLTKEQYYSLLEHYNSGGVPTYGLYDADGVEKWTRIGVPDVDQLKAKILESLP